MEARPDHEAGGQVLVRGERVPERVRRLAAGEALEVTDATAAAVAPEPAAAHADEASDADASVSTGIRMCISRVVDSTTGLSA